jgi:GNAT superfamily N-acetyltransferase
MSNPSVSIEPLGTQDIPRAMELVAAANWNQSPQDWRRFIDFQPAGCFKALLHGALVGTVTSTCYGTELAWIGMMLVDPELRRRGIGTLLMQRVIDHLHSRSVRTIKLDATPAGRPLYAQLGFHAEHDFQRWRRPVVTAADKSVPNEARCETHFRFDDYAALDRDAFGADRGSWLQRFASVSHVVCRAEGFGMLRPGRIASYLGPITAHNLECAESIIEELLSGTTEPVFWDVPYRSPAATTLAQRWQFEPVRDLTRMWLGDALVPKSPQHQFALCDPATG